MSAERQDISNCLHPLFSRPRPLDRRSAVGAFSSSASPIPLFPSRLVFPGATAVWPWGKWQPSQPHLVRLGCTTIFLEARIDATGMGYDVHVFMLQYFGTLHFVKHSRTLEAPQEPFPSRFLPFPLDNFLPGVQHPPSSPSSPSLHIRGAASHPENPDRKQLPDTSIESRLLVVQIPFVREGGWGWGAGGVGFLSSSLGSWI